MSGNMPENDILSDNLDLNYLICLMMENMAKYEWKFSLFDDFASEILFSEILSEFF